MAESKKKPNQTATVKTDETAQSGGAAEVQGEQITEKDLPAPATSQPGETEAPKALQFRSIYDISRDLSRPLQPKFISVRKQGGRDIKYISWYNATKMLDFYAPGWNYEICKVMHIDGCISLTVRITIPCAEGISYREAIGFEKDDNFTYGDPFSIAESMALRRAASKFGLGRYLYGD